MTTPIPTLLILEPSTADRQFYEQDLNKNNSFNLVFANTAADVMDKLFDLSQTMEEVDLILTELVLPEGSGLDLIRSVAASAFYNIPIFAVTSCADPQTQLSAIETGAVDCLQKPMDVPRLLARIRSFISLKIPQGDDCLKAISIKTTYDRLIDDLKVAQHLQNQTLPNPIEDTALHVKGIYMPYEFLGGDLYFWTKIKEGCYGIILLDVMGHGTATSLICMYLRSVLPQLIQKHPRPSDLIVHLNRIMVTFNAQLSGQPYHCTAFYMYIDTINRKISYVNAGHPYVALIDNEQDITWLDKGCIPLGIFDELTPEEETHPYEPGNRALLYSDGIYDLLQQQNLNIEYMMNYLRFYCGMAIGNGTTLDKLYRLIEQLPRFDDVSLVYIELMEGNIQNE